MKMAEQPSDVTAEAPPPTSDDPVEKSAIGNADDVDASPTVENDSEIVPAEETVPQETTGSDDGKAEQNGESGSRGEPTVSNEETEASGEVEDGGNKPSADENPNPVENNSEAKTIEKETSADAANEDESPENLIKSDDTAKQDDSKPSENESVVQKDAGNTETKESTSAPSAAEVDDGNDDSLLPPVELESKSANVIAESDANVVEESEIQKDENLSDLNADQLRERYALLQTKYAASESELNSLRDQNAEFRAKIKTFEDDRKLSSAIELNEKTKQRDGLRVQADYLAHELSQQQDTEKYLREKLTEVLQEREESERRVKDLQLRLKRFVKDDMAKDERVARLEAELREISQEVQQMETYLDEESLQKVKTQRKSADRTGQNGAAGGGHAGRGTSPTPQSKTCVIL